MSLLIVVDEVDSMIIGSTEVEESFMVVGCMIMAFMVVNSAVDTD
jgi:hypothetical protein